MLRLGSINKPKGKRRVQVDSRHVAEENDSGDPYGSITGGEKPSDVLKSIKVFSNLPFCNKRSMMTMS